jgi:hypothetical protein
MSENAKQQLVNPSLGSLAPQKSGRCAAVIGMGLFMTLAAGCARSSEKKKAAAIKPPDTGALAQKNAPAEAWQPRLGKILVVKDKLEFVLIDIGTAPAPAAGAILLAYTEANPSAELAVSSFQKRPYLIADIVSGVPRAGDTVAIKPRPPAVSTPKSRPAPAPALTGDSPPKIAPLPWRPSSSMKDAGDRDSFTPPGLSDPRDPRGGADNGSGVEGIIPGLPLRTPR